MQKKGLILFIAVTMTAGCILPVSAGKVSEMKKQKKAVESKIENISQEKASAKKELTSAVNKKEHLKSLHLQEKEEYQKKLDELKQLSKDIKTIDDAIEEAEEHYQHQMELFKKRLNAMYENMDHSYLQMFAESKNIVDVYAKIDIMSEISKKDKELIEEIKMEKKDIEYKKSLREEERMQLQKVTNQSEDKLKGLSSSRAELDEQIRGISEKLQKLEKEEDLLIKKSEELADEIKDLQSRGGRYIGGTMTWPVPSSSSIVSSFGFRMHPILKKRKMHTGIDIDASYGKSITAANKGTVILAGWKNGYGNTVVIDHGGGITTLYGHCSKLLVKKGERVDAGNTIAKIGSTGLSTGPHLHFEVRVNGQPANPVKYVGR